MPTNNQTDACISTEGEALVFWAPGQQPRRHSSRDPQGRLLLEAQTSVAAGRSWTLAKAAQLIRNDARPHRECLQGPQLAPTPGSWWAGLHWPG